MLYTDIDVSNLEYKALSVQKNGGRSVLVVMAPGSSERLHFQMSENEETNLQTAVWGLSSPIAGADASKRNFELAIESPELLAFLEALDEKNVQMAVAQSQAWFRKDLDRESIEQMYMPIVKRPTKDDQKPSVKVKVRVTERPTEIFVRHSKTEEYIDLTKGTPDDLVRNAKCLAVVETTGLWFMSRQFGMSLNATNLMVSKPRRMATGVDAFTFSTGVKPRERKAEDTCDPNSLKREANDAGSNAEANKEENGEACKRRRPADDGESRFM
jgi:hypothetical protein